MIKLLTSGFWTSVQDLGRHGYRKSGIPLSGVMDRTSAMLANQVVGNAPEAAVVEITASGPVLESQSSCFIAVSGGFDLKIAGVQQAHATKCYASAGSTIEFVPNGMGIRGYLAVRGGLDVEEVMGSHSQYVGVTTAARLQKGATLPLAGAPVVATKPLPHLGLKPPTQDSLSVYPGPEWEQLDKQMQEAILNSEWEVQPQSNRMAYVLGAKEGVAGFDIVTAPVQPGMVQLTPSGQLVVLMRDAQTTGGYARVFQLDEPSMDVVAQRSSGEQLRFRLSDV